MKFLKKKAVQGKGPKNQKEVKTPYNNVLFEGKIWVRGFKIKKKTKNPYKN